MVKAAFLTLCCTTAPTPVHSNSTHPARALRQIGLQDAQACQAWQRVSGQSGQSREQSWLRQQLIWHTEAEPRQLVQGGEVMQVVCPARAQGLQRSQPHEGGGRPGGLPQLEMQSCVSSPSLVVC